MTVARTKLLLPLLALTLLVAQAAVAAGAPTSTARLQAVGSSKVTGSAILTALGGGTKVSLYVRGLAPGTTAKASLHAGTPARPSASFASLPALRAGADGTATARGLVLFRGRENVRFGDVADGQHVIVIKVGGRTVASGVVPRPKP